MTHAEEPVRALTLPEMIAEAAEPLPAFDDPAEVDDVTALADLLVRRELRDDVPPRPSHL